MSRNLTRLFFYGLKKILTNNAIYQNNNTIQIKVSGTFLILCAFTHGIYALGTSTPEKSKIIKKYKMVKNGFTDFMVIDEQGNHYNVNNSFWYWKWNSIEDWSNIKEGDELYFKYYGWRVPVLGLFPNIYFINRAKFLDIIECTQFRAFPPSKISTLEDLVNL